MKITIFLLILTTCAFSRPSFAEPSSLGWWFLPDTIEDLPIELEEDDNGYWTELWVRPGIDSKVAPNEVMEQALGARWVGLNPDKDGRPTHVVLSMAGSKVVEFTGEVAKTGAIEGEDIQWDDKTSTPLSEFRRRRRRRNSAKVNFGKITLPPLASKIRTLPSWGVERLPVLLQRVTDGPTSKITVRDLSAPAQIYDANGSFLNLRYDDSCGEEARAKIEDALASDVEPRLTCWMDQNAEGSSKLLGALLQRPTIYCKGSLPKDACGMASLPQAGGFFVSDPKIRVSLDRCKGELNQTLLHEILHLSGVSEKEMSPALEGAESCGSSPATLSFENENEGFFNDFEVQTRIFIFRKVRDEAVEKWHWKAGERDFMLGTICTQMGDKYCSRNYFQKASEENLQGLVELPEGNSVSWSALAQFEFYDSVTEDLQRMHELARYLKRDPNGALLRRIETGVHRLHEFFVARQSLEAVKNNKGICSSETDEHVLCEDLAEIKKTPWFNHP